MGMLVFLTRFGFIHRLTIRSFSTTSLKKNNHLDYCVNLVKTRDYENYLSLTLLPQHAQAVGFTVRAFNIEIAQIQEVTTNIKTGKTRIDFWRKNISSTFKGIPPNHPVTISLALCLEKQMLSDKWFERIIDIRERYINNIAFMSLNDAEEYGEYALSSMFYLILESLGLDHLDSSYAASHLGTACSLVTLLRSTPYFIQNGHVILPTELCVKHSISQEEILQHQNQTALREIVYDIASSASLHLDAMVKLLDDVPLNARNVYLPYFPAKIFLSNIQKLGFDIFNRGLNRKHWTLPAILYFASKRKKW